MSAPLRRCSAPGSLVAHGQAVAWSLIGIRKNSEYQQDLAKVNPFHIIVVGIGGAVLFVVGLIVLVNWVVLAAAPEIQTRTRSERVRS
jgi:hypothetical protein